MTKQNYIGGRPKNLAIKGDIVRKLREERRLTQADLARLVNRELGTHSESEPDSLQKQCWRWENECTISNKASKALAKVLRTTEEHIRHGGAPAPAPDRVEELEHQIRLQLAAGNKRAQQFIDDVRELEAFSGIPKFTDDDSAFHEAARALDARINSAQLTHRIEALTPLMEITGYSLSELLRPGGGHGHWLVASESAFQSTTEIHHGRIAALGRALSLIEEWRRHRSTDSRVTLREDAHWFRIHLEDPVLPQLNTVISCVRFEPTETGLRWSRPAELDRWMIVDRMAGDLSHLFNYVRDFDDNSDWPDPRKMRLELRPALIHTDNQAAMPIARFKGAVEQHIDDRLSAFQKEGQGHEAIMNWLGSDLAEELTPFLSHWPRECWTAEAYGQKIHLILDAPVGITQKLDRAPVIQQREFTLHLVEERDNGSSRHLPWNKESIAMVFRQVNRAIAALPDLTDVGYQFVGPPRPTANL